MKFFADRLTWIRRKRGFTKSALASLAGVDLRSITAYESEDYEPSEESLARLATALKVKSTFFSLGPFEGPNAAQVSFRAISKLSASKRDMALGSAAIAFALSQWMERKFDFPPVNVPDLRGSGDPESAALALRYQWGLGEKPVSNMIHLLESKGILVFSLALDLTDVDACCTWYNDRPFVFLNTKKSGARRRFDAAHELAHLVLHRHGSYDDRDVEREADEFASAFLMPRGGVTSTAPRLVDLKNIVPVKATWGVSAMAYTVRLHRLKMISDWHYRTLCIQLSQRGYRSSEPYDHKPEMSKLAELVLTELRSEGVGISEISGELGVSEKDIADLLFDIAIFGVDGSALISGRTPKKASHLQLVVSSKPEET